MFVSMPFISLADDSQQLQKNDVVQRSVDSRPDCNELKLQIDELLKSDSAADSELVDLRAKYRKYCSKIATNRPKSVRNSVKMVESENVVEQTNESEKNETESLSKVEENPFVENCPDGAIPDKHGCCHDEYYLDMGIDLGYNCCPKTGGDCFPPIEKKKNE